MRAMTIVSTALLSTTLLACAADGLATDDGPENLDDLEGRAAERYIVTLKDQTATGTAWVESHGVTAMEVYDNSVRGCVLRGTPEMAEALRHDPTVASVEQDAVVSLGDEAVLPEGDAGAAGADAAQPGSDEISADAAQVIPGGITRVGGSSITNGKFAYVIDTGIDFNQADLFVVKPLSRNFVKAEPNQGQDLNFHGTHVAGIIGAKDNNIDVIGVVPNTPLVAVRVLNSKGTGLLSEIIAGVDYVAKIARPGEVANMSLGSKTRNAALDQAVINAANRGIFFSVSAGNDHVDAATASPAGVNHPNVFTVSASDAKDCLATFSNFGKGVDFAAPGVGIISTRLGGGTLSVSGTSQAAPHVAGLLLATGGRIRSGGLACKDPDGVADKIAHR